MSNWRFDNFYLPMTADFGLAPIPHTISGGARFHETQSLLRVFGKNVTATSGRFQTRLIFFIRRFSVCPLAEHRLRAQVHSINLLDAFTPRSPSLLHDQPESASHEEPANN